MIVVCCGLTMLSMCVVKCYTILYLLDSHCHIIDYNLMQMPLIGIPGVVSFVLSCNGLGSITWK